MAKTKIERIVLRIPPKLKRQLIEKLNGRSMTYVGAKLVEAWIAGGLKFDDDAGSKARRA